MRKNKNRNRMKALFLTAALLGSTLLGSFPALAAPEMVAEGQPGSTVELPVSQVFSTDVTDFSVTIPNMSLSYNIAQVEGDSMTIEPTQFTLENSGSSAQIKFTFPHAGVYEATITPVANTSAPDAWTLDTTEYYIRAYVKNAGNGELITDITAAKGKDGIKVSKIEYADVFNPCREDPPIEKIIEGASRPDDVFTFHMKADDPSYPMPEGSADGEKVITVGPGSHEFGWMYFDHSGTYTYTVWEEAGTDPNYVYDSTPFKKTTVVEKIDGKLVVTKAVYTRNGTDSEKATFTNRYSTPETDPTPGGGGNGSGGGGRTPRTTPSTPTTPGEVLGATRDAAEDVGRGVLGAVRDPQVLGAVRTGDNSSMVIWAVILMLAVSGIVGWGNMYVKKKKRA